MDKSAAFSPDRKYRYQLVRSWGEGRKLGFVMLNPSTANEEDDDPTIRRCVGFAKAWDYETVMVVNLYALVSTDPRQLLNETESIRPNHEFILRMALFADRIVAAWGNYGTYIPERVTEVLEILNYKPVYCLGINKSGQPRHPLYVKMMPEYALQVYRPSIAKLNIGTR